MTDGEIETTITMTRTEFFQIAKKFYYAGEHWGTSYQGWFAPTETEHVDNWNKTEKSIIDIHSNSLNK